MITTIQYYFGMTISCLVSMLAMPIFFILIGSIRLFVLIFDTFKLPYNAMKIYDRNFEIKKALLKEFEDNWKNQKTLDEFTQTQILTSMLKIYRQIYGKQAEKFPNGREYLIDNETKQHAKFSSVEEIINLFKSEGHDVNTEVDLANMGVNIESVDE